MEYKNHRHVHTKFSPLRSFMHDSAHTESIVTQDDTFGVPQSLQLAGSGVDPACTGNLLAHPGLSRTAILYLVL